MATSVAMALETLAVRAPPPGTLSVVSIETPEELAGLRASGRVVAEALRAMRRAVRPGITTAELDAIAARIFRRTGARSAPRLTYGFPGVTCISVNDEAVHGIPGPRRLRQGDLVSLDVAAELGGFYADACVTVAVGRARPATNRLAVAARHALADGLAAARAGAPQSAIGAAVERATTARGYAVCVELMGHGIGRHLHEAPDVPSVFDAALTQPLTDGLVLTVEPIVSAGTGAVRQGRDSWTVCTADGALAAHEEHTIVITPGAPLVLTA
jgi:methionyl aminopeptidase